LLATRVIMEASAWLDSINMVIYSIYV